MPRTVLATSALVCAAFAWVPGTAGAYTITQQDHAAETAGSVTYTVTQQALDPASASVTVSGSGPSPATPGSDVGAPQPQTLTFNGFGGQLTVKVPIVNDGADEPAETFAVTVTGSGQATGNSTTTTIDDDDTTVDVAATNATEGGAASVTLVPRAASAREVRVDYATIAGNAGAADFTPASGTVTWAANDTTPRTVAIATTADALDEDDERFGVLFASPADTVSAAAVPVTITDDDPPPLAGAVATRVTERDSGTTAARVLVALSRASGRTIRIPYTTRPGTAVAPGDYTSTTGTLVFSPGETAQVAAVPIRGDRAPEADETFTLALGEPENAALAPATQTATVTIGDDDGGAGDRSPPRLRLAAPRARGPRITMTVGCPAAERACRGRVTLFTVASRRARVPQLREERRLARAGYRLRGGTTRRLTLRLRATDLRLLRRARSIRVRAFAVTTDAAGNVGNTSRGATLRFG